MNGNRWHYSVANQCCVEPPPKIQLRTVYRIENFVYRTLNFVPPEHKSLNEKKNFIQKTRSLKLFFAIAKLHKFYKKFGNLLKNSSNRRKLSKYYYYLDETEFQTLQYSELFYLYTHISSCTTYYHQVFSKQFTRSVFVTFL